MKTLLCTVPGTLPGVSFNVVIVRKGDRYGLDDCLTWDSDNPGVEFYDVRHKHTPFGQFVSRYFAKTLLCPPCIGGLDLTSFRMGWEVSAEGMDTVRAKLKERP